MAICQHFANIDPVISTTLKKNQLPALDTFGPFPDETLLSNIDRLLFLLGARKLQKYFNLPTPSCDGLSDSDCSLTISCPDEHGRYRSCSAFGGGMVECKCPLPSRSVSGTKKSRSACAKYCVSRILCPPPKRPSSVTISDTISLCGDGSSPKKRCQPMKRSFSLCSLACRKLKQLMSFQSMKEGAPKWLWTRMQCYGDGTRVFEIYENTGACNKPPNMKSAQPKIIFVVLSNGCIVPFESLKGHK